MKDVKKKGESLRAVRETSMLKIINIHVIFHWAVIVDGTSLKNERVSVNYLQKYMFCSMRGR